MKVLFINHPFVQCGVYQLGQRIYDIVSKSKKVDYYYCDISNKDGYEYALRETKPDTVIFNYHWDRMPWLEPSDITNNKSAKHFFVFHDGSMFPIYDKYLFFGDLDPKRTAVPENKRALLPRPLLKYNGIYPENKVITVGSFGFVARYKRFPDLVKLVNRVCTEAVINLHITRPYFGDKPGASFGETALQCLRNVTRPGIKLNINSEFYNNDQLLEFLAGNDINVFYYDEQPNPGISSAPDYALSVKRPIAITRVKMLRHIYDPNILLDKHNLMSIWQRGTKPLEKHYKEWSQGNFLKAMDKLILEGK